MAQIRVARVRESEFEVTVQDGESRTLHTVVVLPGELARYAPSGQSPERLLEASFEFLLEREPPEAILRKFDLPLIERYFPEYPQEIRRRL